MNGATALRAMECNGVEDADGANNRTYGPADSAGLNGERGLDVTFCEQMALRRISVHRGDYLYRAGDRFSALFAIKCGTFKTYSINENGRSTVNGFHLSGDVIGLDAIASSTHLTFAVPLETSLVYMIPYTPLESACVNYPDLPHRLCRLLALEIVRNQELATLLSSRRADEKVAIFILDLSHRLALRGYASDEFYLRMSREEIGSYLGLTLETVSRILSWFQACGICRIDGKFVRELNTKALVAVLGEGEFRRGDSAYSALPRDRRLGTDRTVDAAAKDANHWTYSFHELDSGRSVRGSKTSDVGLVARH